MITKLLNVLEMLESSAERLPQKNAVRDNGVSCTYCELVSKSRAVGSALSRFTATKRPVAVLMEKGTPALTAFFGAVYAGCFYVFFNPALPTSRLKKMEEVLGASLVITDKAHFEIASNVFENKEILFIEELVQQAPNQAVLEQIRAAATDTDPLYINFTSGSTGTPKGVIINHRSVIDFICVFTKTFHISQNDVIANQAPFDFDVSVKDIYSCLYTGAELVIVPKALFSQPAQLLDFLCDNEITTMIWAVSALCLITTFHALDYRVPETVNKILFSGEVMPEKHLKQWIKALPNTLFVNLYGPTEITCNCTYHIVKNDTDTFPLPIGIAFENENVFLLDAHNNAILESGVTGEICVSGTALSPGYYNAAEQTAKAFVQNPLNPYYPEIIYRTGDLGYFDEKGEMYFCGRKDFQIKYRGHRIELEEVENAIHSVEGMKRCCCIFDEAKSKLYCFYVGSMEKRELVELLKQQLPEFMIPGAFRKLEELPLTKNGKIDRKQLKERVIKK